MDLAERSFDGLRIYAAALPASASVGFHAAVVVLAPRADDGRRAELFRDECLLGGRGWMDPDGALAFALEAGQAAVLAQRGLAGRLRAAPAPA
jgi:hypothetical protein